MQRFVNDVLANPHLNRREPQPRLAESDRVELPTEVKLGRLEG